jgi:glycosyltransferase involved in cell wall biosynthesis
MLHVHSRRDFVSAVIAVKLAARQMARRPRLILHVHQVRRLGDGGFLADMFFNWGADKVLAVSGAVKSKLVGGSILQRRLVDVLMNGVNESEYQIPGSAQAYEWRKEMRSKWGLTPTGPVIGMVGRLDQKGQLFVVSCLPEILKRAPDTQIVLIGPPGKRGTIDDLKSAAMAGGCIDRVIFAGEVKNMPAAYAAMDLLVHLPTDEAFGLAIAEAMASSIPVVAGEVGGCVELVRHNETGLLIEPRDKGQLVDAIGRIFDQSGDLFRSEFGIAARKRIESCFTFDRQVDNLEEIYDRLSLTGS